MGDPERNLDGERELSVHLHREILRHVRFFLDRGEEDVYLLGEVTGAEGTVTHGAVRFITPCGATGHRALPTTCVFLELDPTGQRVIDHTSFSVMMPGEEERWAHDVPVLVLAKVAALSDPAKARRIPSHSFFALHAQVNPEIARRAAAELASQSRVARTADRWSDRLRRAGRHRHRRR